MRKVSRSYWTQDKERRSSSPAAKDKWRKRMVFNSRWKECNRFVLNWTAFNATESQYQRRWGTVSYLMITTNGR